MEFLSSACVGAAAACFWQKEFRIAALRDVLRLLLTAVPARVDVSVVVVVTLHLTATTTRAFNFEYAIAVVHKNMLMVVMLTAFVFACRVEPLGLGLLALVAMVSAAFQLLRRPAWLKEALRPIRIAMGPLYGAASIMIFVRVGSQSSAVHATIAVIGIFSVLAASAVFRPDNTELERAIMAVFGQDLLVKSLRRRASVHGVLMLLSVVILALVLAGEGHRAAACGLFGLLAMEAGRRGRPT